MSDPAQFGSGTIIPADVQLLILDCFETLVELDGRRYTARRGVPEFLEFFARGQGLPVTVVSDGAAEAVARAIADAGLGSWLAEVWSAPESLEYFPDGRSRKRLDLPMARFKAARERTVFIGDSPLDAEAARHHRMPFIRVPRSEDRQFTFSTLISGPSRYQSTEFSAAFLDQYLKNRKP